MGLISMHGHRRGSSVGMLSMMERMELPRPPLAMLRFRMLISEPFGNGGRRGGNPRGQLAVKLLLAEFLEPGGVALVLLYLLTEFQPVEHPELLVPVDGGVDEHVVQPFEE